MFNNKRYITSGIDAIIPKVTQLLLWELIAMMDVEKRDYLQVFKLDTVNIEGLPMQRITHIQEEPEYLREHVMPTELPIRTKIYVIDDGPHSTMLLSSEY